KNTWFAYSASRVARLFLDRLARTFTGSRIGFGALATQRQATTVPQPTVTTQVHQALDVHVHFTAKVAFDHVLGDFAADLVHLVVGDIGNLGVFSDTHCLANTFRLGPTDPKYIGQRDYRMLVVGNVDTGNTGHSCYSTVLKFSLPRLFPSEKRRKIIASIGYKINSHG